MKAAGLDIGTTTVSAVVLDVEQGTVVESRTIPNGSFIRTDRKWEKIQDAALLCGKAEAVLEELLKLHPDVRSIGLTGQMHGIVYTDREGRCVSPLYTWQDQRGEVPEADGQSLSDCVRQECGIHVSAGYGLLTHLYQERKGLVPDRAVSFCTIADLAGMYLTGRKKPLVHRSNAASMGFYDVRRGCFQEEYLRKMGIAPAMLPEVTGDLATLGMYRGIPVTVGIGDNQASFLGSVGMRERTLLLNMGTGGQISVLSGQYFEAPGIEARPFLDGKYLLVGSSLCGGRAYAVLERFFRSIAEAAGAEDRSQYGLMERLAGRGEKETDGMKVCTAFQGTRTDPGQRGSITNITEENFTPEGLVYGVLEGMARELYEMYETIRQGTGIHAEHLVASGNGVRKNPVLQNILRRMFGAELQLAACGEEAACGAAASGIQLDITDSYRSCPVF